MSVNKTQYNKLQSNSKEKDYFEELHNLMIPENMEQIRKMKSQKLANMIKLKQLYEHVYNPYQYNHTFSKEQRKKMMSKITLKEAEELYDFIHAIGIKIKGEKQHKFYYNEEMVKNIAKPSTNLDQTTDNENITLKLNEKEIVKNTEFDKKDLSSAKLKKHDHVNIVNDKELKEYDFKHLKEEFVKRNKALEKPSVTKEGKPHFVEQISKIKKSKVSINIFPFHDHDKINIIGDSKKIEDPTVINLIQVKPKEEIKNVEEPELKHDNIKTNVKVDLEIKDDLGKILVQKIIYPEQHEENNKKKNKKVKKNIDTLKED